jgi:hypothetical protein
MVSHLFRGDCVRILSDCIHCVGLYEDSACTEVTLDMETASVIVSHVLNSVLLRLMFYSTDSLHDIARVVVPQALEVGEDRRALVARLHTFHSSLEHTELAYDPMLLFSRIERLTKCSVVGMGALHGVTVGGDREVVCGALVSHEIGGECVLPVNEHMEACTTVVQHYLQGSTSSGSLELQIWLLSEIQSRINLRPLHRLLRLINVTFEEGASLK